MVKRNVDWVFFTGKGSWFNNLVFGDQEYSNWNIKLYLSDQSYADFMALKETKGDVEGIMNEVKMDEEGGHYHIFKRPFRKDFGNGEELLTPPIVVDKNNQPWDVTKKIGNGSDITVKCELYTYTNRRAKKKGRAIRLSSVRIDEYVPYTANSFTDDQKKQVAGMDNVAPEAKPLF